MNNIWFECKVALERVLENGMVKKVQETYLVEAMKHSEAEQRIVRELSLYASGELEVISVMRRHFSEIFKTDDAAADRWYEAELVYTVLDEKAGIEKKVPEKVLIQATDFHDALRRLESVKWSKIDYDVVSMIKKPYLDLLPVFRKN